MTALGEERGKGLMKAIQRRRLLRLVEEQGLDRPAGKGRPGIILMPPSGRSIPLRTHRTGDWRYRQNLRASLRRAGLVGVEEVT